MYNPTFLGDIDLNEDTLAHYGVKGMKWRRRKGQKKKGMNYQDSRFQRQTNGINTRRDKRFTNIQKYSGGEQWQPKTTEERQARSMSNFNSAPESQRTSEINGKKFVEQVMRYRGEPVVVEVKKKKK